MDVKSIRALQVRLFCCRLFLALQRFAAQEVLWDTMCTAAPLARLLAWVLHFPVRFGPMVVLGLPLSRTNAVLVSNPSRRRRQSLGRVGKSGFGWIDGWMDGFVHTFLLVAVVHTAELCLEGKYLPPCRRSTSC